MGYSNIPGWGVMDAEMKDSLRGCGYECFTTDGCCSFEYSPTLELCSLIRECEPTGDDHDDDSIFCTRDDQVTTPVSSLSCNSPSSLGDHCYKIFLPASSWSAADSACSAAGGHLAKVASQTANHLIKQLALDKTASTVLLGGKKVDGDGEYSWPGGDNGDLSSYTNFAPGQNIPGDCILLSSDNGQWTPVECSSPVTAFVCQMDSSGNSGV